MYHITIIAGARPNFIKISPIIKAIERQKVKGKRIEYKLVHTGQHYDNKMSSSFFEELEIPAPDTNLGAGGGTQSEQTAKIILGFEKYLLENRTDLVLVVGDVTSTMACTITAKKMNIKVAHIEAGIRSFDWSMPEEINRIITDSICDFYFTTTEQADQNLINMGIDPGKIFFVGNCMIDTLLEFRSKFKKPTIWNDLKLQEKSYFVLTLHRPSNVDEELYLKSLLEEISKNTKGLPIIFPAHPRTRNIINSLNISSCNNLHIVEPMSYLNFNYLVSKALAVLTDSGGITEETTVLNVPCLTLRDNTERPETVTIGTNLLVGREISNIIYEIKRIFNKEFKKSGIPKLWDGKTSNRIVEKIIELNSEIIEQV